MSSPFPSPKGHCNPYGLSGPHPACFPRCLVVPIPGGLADSRMLKRIIQNT